MDRIEKLVERFFSGEEINETHGVYTVSIEWNREDDPTEEEKQAEADFWGLEPEDIDVDRHAILYLEWNSGNIEKCDVYRPCFVLEDLDESDYKNLNQKIFGRGVYDELKERSNNKKESD